MGPEISQHKLQHKASKPSARGRYESLDRWKDWRALELAWLSRRGQEGWLDAGQACREGKGRWTGTLDSSKAGGLEESVHQPVWKSGCNQSRRGKISADAAPEVCRVSHDVALNAFTVISYV